MNLYEIEIKVEKIKDGGDYEYIATSPDLPGLLVAGDTVDEVLTLAPQVAAALIASIQEAGDPLPDSLQVTPTFPFTSHIAVAV